MLNNHKNNRRVGRKGSEQLINHNLGATNISPKEKFIKEHIDIDLYNVHLPICVLGDIDIDLLEDDNMNKISADQFNRFMIRFSRWKLFIDTEKFKKKFNDIINGYQCLFCKHDKCLKFFKDKNLDNHIKHKLSVLHEFRIRLNIAINMTKNSDKIKYYLNEFQNANYALNKVLNKYLDLPNNYCSRTCQELDARNVF